MDTNLVTAETLRALLTNQASHTSLLSSAINCCAIGDVFYQTERLKKDGHTMDAVIRGDTEFNRAVMSAMVSIAPLDQQAIESCLFKNSFYDVEFFADVQNASHPSECIDRIALRHFDQLWSTDFLTRRFNA